MRLRSKCGKMVLRYNRPTSPSNWTSNLSLGCWCLLLFTPFLCLGCWLSFTQQWKCFLSHEFSTVSDGLLKWKPWWCGRPRRQMGWSSSTTKRPFSWDDPSSYGAMLWQSRSTDNVGYPACLFLFISADQYAVTINMCIYIYKFVFFIYPTLGRKTKQIPSPATVSPAEWAPANQRRSGNPCPF